MLKIGFLLGEFSGKGGIAKVTALLAKGLNDEKFDKSVTLFTYSKSKLIEVYDIPQNIKVTSLLQKNQSMTKTLLKLGHLKLRKMLNENNIDILIICGALFFPLALLATKGTKIKTIAWEHSNYLNKKDHNFQSLSRNIGAKYADSFVVLTKKDKQLFSKIRKNNIYQVYNPVDPKLYINRKDYNIYSKKIISVGRLSYQKYFSAVIEIAKIIRPLHPDWVWHIFGDGDEYDLLNKKIIEYELQEFLILKGNVTNIYDLYSDYAFLVMTSRYEGFPMTLLEAFANKLPCVCFNVLTGPNEIVVDGLNGFLVEPFEINEMAKKILFLIENDNKRKEFSSFGAEKIQEFSQSEITKQWLTILEKTLR